MINKTQDAYIALFRALKDFATANQLLLNPTTIWSDFESGLIPAVQTEFPMAVHRGCYFHHTQAVFRKVQQLGLQQDYRTDEQLRNQVRHLMALGFIPTGHVRHVFAILRQQADHRLAALFDYFEHQWIHNTPLAMWNVYGLRRRTNNDLEGWHYRFNALVQKHHPNIFLLIECIQKEQAATEVTVHQILGGGQHVNRINAKYESINRRIDDARAKLERMEIDIFQYLHRVSFSLAAHD